MNDRKVIYIIFLSYIKNMEVPIMAKHGFPGFGGANMSNLMKQAQKMQRDMENYKPNSRKRS